jgi:type I restriction enzyme M protein
MTQNKKSSKKKTRKIDSARSLSVFVKSICNIMRRSNCASALQYVPELTWILFLRILDEQERKDRESAEAVGNSFSPALVSPFRWQDWAAPFGVDPAHPKTPQGKPYGWKRQELFSQGDGRLFTFINTELLPHLHSLDIDPKTKLPDPSATPKQRIIGRIMTAVERVRLDNETNLRDILDKVDEISIDHVDDTHFFTLSQVYEDLLLKMGEKNSDGGQFFTPREVIRAMVHSIQPKIGETIYDPCCGTGGFLAIAYEHLVRNMGNAPASTDIDRLKHDTFFGREKENLVFPIALANLVLHGIDQPNLWHGNTLTKRPIYSALFDKAPKHFDIILTNPPFGGKEGKDAQKNYPFPTGSTQVLFVQDIFTQLDGDGRCAIVLDDGFLFRVDEAAFVETKRKLVDECNVMAIVSLPIGVFSGAGADVKTNLVFFSKGSKTTKIWYYDITHIKVGKKSPMTLAHFGFSKSGEPLDDHELPSGLIEDWLEDETNKGKPFPSYARLLSKRGTPDGESRYSWTIDFAARRKRSKEEMDPYLEQAEGAKIEIVLLKEKLKALKKSNAGLEAIEAIEIQIKDQEKAARDFQSKADSIGASVFDLKAVNPNVVEKYDVRTPTEVLQSIQDQSKIVKECLETIRALLLTYNSCTMET